MVSTSRLRYNCPSCKPPARRYAVTTDMLTAGHRAKLGIPEDSRLGCSLDARAALSRFDHWRELPAESRCIIERACEKSMYQPTASAGLQTLRDFRDTYVREDRTGERLLAEYRRVSPRRHRTSP